MTLFPIERLYFYILNPTSISRNFFATPLPCVWPSFLFTTVFSLSILFFIHSIFKNARDLYLVLADVHPGALGMVIWASQNEARMKSRTLMTWIMIFGAHFKSVNAWKWHNDDILVTLINFLCWFVRQILVFLSIQTSDKLRLES